MAVTTRATILDFRELNPLKNQSFCLRWRHGARGDEEVINLEMVYDFPKKEKMSTKGAATCVWSCAVLWWLWPGVDAQFRRRSERNDKSSQGSGVDQFVLLLFLVLREESIALESDDNTCCSFMKASWMAFPTFPWAIYICHWLNLYEWKPPGKNRIIMKISKSRNHFSFSILLQTACIEDRGVLTVTSGCSSSANDQIHALSRCSNLSICSTDLRRKTLDCHMLLPVHLRWNPNFGSTNHLYDCLLDLGKLAGSSQ